MDVARKTILPIESEDKHALEILDSLIRSVNGQGARIRAKWAQIIESEDVISMGVCEHDGIDATNIFSQALHAKIGTCIDHECGFRCFHVNG